MKNVVPIIIVFGFFCTGYVFAQEFTLLSSDVQGQLTVVQVYSWFGSEVKNISPAPEWVNVLDRLSTFPVQL